jgi:tight adherence protein B
MTAILMKLFLYISVFSAVLLGIEAALNITLSYRAERQKLNKRLHLIASGIDRADVLSHLRRDMRPSHSITGFVGQAMTNLDRKIAESGLHISLPGFLTIMATLGAITFGGPILAILVLGSLLSLGKLFIITLFAVIISIFLPLVIIGRMGDKRRLKLAEQFPLALDVFVRGLRAGHPVASALELLALDLPDPLGSEFGIVIDEVTYGLDLRDALQNMADRCGLEDMQMFVVSIAVQTETGGNLAEILENLSLVIRERATMVMMVRALSSEGRMTATMLTGLPVFAFAGLFALNPRFYLDVSDDPAFFPSIFVLLALYSIGFYSIRRMIDLKV